MSGFSLGGFLGHLIPSLEKGVAKGIQYDIDWARLEIKAFSEGNTAMLTDLNAVKAQWLAEAADAAGIVKGNVVGLLLAGGDPFAGSRKLMQDVETKYGKP